MKKKTAKKKSKQNTWERKLWVMVDKVGKEKNTGSQEWETKREWLFKHVCVNICFSEMAISQDECPWTLMNQEVSLANRLPLRW